VGFVSGDPAEVARLIVGGQVNVHGVAGVDESEDVAGDVLVDARECAGLNLQSDPFEDLAAYGFIDGFAMFEEVAGARCAARTSRRRGTTRRRRRTCRRCGSNDLRHVGNTLASNTGANLRELMARMGHASSQAALIYQLATAERDRAIADALGDMISKVLGQDDDET
jgi:hypothetical protein